MSKFRDFVRSVNPIEAVRPVTNVGLSVFTAVFPQVIEPLLWGPVMNQATSSSSRWVIAIDGGGSKVAGAASKLDLAGALPPYSLATIRHVADGTGSAAIATWDKARSNLITMLERLLVEAAVGPEKISSAVLMLAGAGRPEDVARVTESLIHNSPFGSCVRLTVTSDIQPLLCDARDCDTESSSIVVIAGTGSLVAALDADGQVVRAGGWGPMLGDEGSGWRIAQAFLKPFCTWIDGGLDPARTPAGLHLLTRFLAAQHMPIASEKLNSAIIALASDRRLAAQLAPAIMELSTQPNGAATFQFVRNQIWSLADQVQQVHHRLAISNQAWRLCLSGGLASNDKLFQNFLLTELKRRAIAPASVTVLDPLAAALRFAAKVA